MSFSLQNLPKNFYVYAYLRNDGSPYYIGKGYKKRAWQKGKNEINPPKDKNFIIILEHNLTEIGAFALERRYIRWYGRKDNNTGILRNKSDGGEGPSGRVYVVSQETKRKLSEIHKGKTLSIEHKMKLSKFQKSRKRKPWSEETKNKISQSKRKNFILISPEGIQFNVLGLNEFCEKNNLHQPSISKVINGKTKQHKGWIAFRL